MPYRKMLTITEQMPDATKLFLLILAVFAPLRDVVYVVIFLVVVDIFSSVFYQMKRRCALHPDVRGLAKLMICFRVVESSKLRYSVSKLLFYVLALMAFYVFDFYVLHVKPMQGDTLITFSLTNMAAILICVTELTSIASNISKITNNPIFNTIMKVFGKKIEEKLMITPKPDEDTTEHSPEQ